MTPELFAALSGQGYNRIPVYTRVLADLDTPLSTYLKLANAPYSYFFESVEGGEKWGRYSIIGLPAKEILRVYGNSVKITREGKLLEAHDVSDPLQFVTEYQARFRVAPVDELSLFTGGLVGYFGYDTVRYIEPRLADASLEDPIGTPDILLMVSDELVVFDNLTGSLTIVTHVDPAEPHAYEKAQANLHAVIRSLKNEVPKVPELSTPQVSAAEMQFSYPEAEFKKGVDKIKEYVLSGDIMQVVLAQRMSVPFTAHPLQLYRALRHLNPSPYMYFLDLDDFHIVGSSPEILARSQHGKVTVRPIAGTRKRGVTEEKDRELEQELLNDPKEIAEHLMLIDLGRNDVGRVAEVGSVQLTEKMIVERYSHVMHIVSNVEATLKPEFNAIDVLRATFPAGTLSCAPKIRAMEIIDELESVKRGIYGGAVGYIAWNGDMDTAIAIRTGVIKDGQLHIQAGAGVVADSVPQSEWEETMNKGRALLSAVDMVAKGLAPVR
ncbi:MAG TPA: anthranilate synthase component I [Pseudomonadales bacterium]|nr:anthranilate synthase component I [Pseudomonadales bacterium]